MTHITEMKKLIFIDACMRAGSRTRRIARPIIAELGKRISPHLGGRKDNHLFL